MCLVLAGSCHAIPTRQLLLSPAALLQVHLTLPELPPETRAMLLTVSSFEAGFKNVRSLHARLVQEEPQQQLQQENGETPEAGESEEDAPKPRKKGPKQPSW